VDFAVLGWPVSDPLARYHMVRERANARLMEAHHAFCADEAAMGEGSPLDIVTRGDAQRLPSLLTSFKERTRRPISRPTVPACGFIDAYHAKAAAPNLRFLRRRPHDASIARDPASAGLARCASYV